LLCFFFLSLSFFLLQSHLFLPLSLSFNGLGMQRLSFIKVSHHQFIRELGSLVYLCYMLGSSLLKPRQNVLFYYFDVEAIGEEANVC